MELMRSKQREAEGEKELKALEEENTRFEMAADVRRAQEKQAIREIMLEQIELDRMRKKYDRDAHKEPTATHFGPCEDNLVMQEMINRKREMQNAVNSDLHRQMASNHDKLKKKI